MGIIRHRGLVMQKSYDTECFCDLASVEGAINTASKKKR